MKYLFLTCALMGCAQMKIKDFTACADAGISGAVCDKYLTDHQTILNKQEWDALRMGWLCVSAQDFSELKLEIEQICSEVKCSYEQSARMHMAFQKIQNMQSKAAAGRWSNAQ